MFLLFVAAFSNISGQMVAFSAAANDNANGNVDDIAFVAIQALPAGTIIYFTTEEYNGTAFGSSEDQIAWTAPAGVDVGDVFYLSETTANSFTITCSDGSGTTTCGSAVVEDPSYTFGNVDEIYAYSDNDNDRTNGITEIHAALHLNGTFSSAENPLSEYPNAQVLEVPRPSSGNDKAYVEFSGDRTIPVDLADLSDLSKFTVAEAPSPDLSTVAFSGGFFRALPVELSSFRVRNKKNIAVLTWQTATESENAGFELQRGMDGVTFESVAFIEGNGTSATTRDYAYDDKDLRSGQLYYYRLKQLDYDGTFAYSKIITAQLTGNEITGTFAPNPVTAGNTTLNYATPTSGEMVLRVFDAAGKTLQERTYAVTEGSNRFALDLDGLSAGMYFVKMEQGEQYVYEKVVVR